MLQHRRREQRADHARALVWSARLIGLLLPLSAASAQPEPAAQAPAPTEDPNVVAAARALAVEGVKLAREDRCAEAIDKLERAEQLRHSAIVLAELGGCYIELGRVVEGAEAMRRVLRESLPPDASEAHETAHTTASTMLEQAKAKIAMLTIAVEGAADASPQVTVDGRELPAALIGAARPTDPGEHTIEAAAPGYLPARRRVNLAPGESAAVRLALVEDPAARTAAYATEGDALDASGANAEGELAAPSSQPSAASAGPDRWPAYVALGTSAAALTVGVAFGWVAMDQKADLDRVCPAKRCPPEQSARLDAAKTNGVVSSVAFGVGVAAAALGGVLLLLANDAADSQPSAAKAGVRLGGSPLGGELRLAF